MDTSRFPGPGFPGTASGPAVARARRVENPWSQGVWSG